MRKSLLTKAALPALLLSASVYADEQTSIVSNIAIGADLWAPHAKVDEVNRGRSSSPAFFMSLEHTLPYLPEFQFRYSAIDTDTLTFDKYDYTLYYQLLEHDLLTFDLGFTWSDYRDGRYRNLMNTDKTFSEWTRSVYAKGTIMVPNTNFELMGQFDFGDTGNTKTSEVIAAVQYRIPLAALNAPNADLHLRGGYRVMDNEFGYFESSEGNVMLNGWFAGFQFDF